MGLEGSFRTRENPKQGTALRECAGETPVGILPGVVIAWDDLVLRLPKPGF